MAAPQNRELFIYADYASQPSRAVIGFCQLNKIKYTLVETRVGKREHLAPEFIAINPAMLVPAIVEVDKTTGDKWNLFESHAIMRYLASTHNVPDHWYPKDVLKRSLVDQYLDWHHSFLRQAVGYQIYKRLFAPMIHGIHSTEDELKFYAMYQKRTLDLIERWLSQNTFLCGSEISIADLSAACELIQGRFIEVDLSKHPLTKTWLDKIIFGIPEMAEIHKPVLKFAEASLKKRKEMPKL